MCNVVAVNRHSIVKMPTLCWMWSGGAVLSFKYLLLNLKKKVCMSDVYTFFLAGDRKGCWDNK